MPGTRPTPIIVSAKVVTAARKVPALGDAPFTATATLERGVHVHWMLPYQFRQAKLCPGKGENLAVFPGVPDLWLVVRFNPCLAYDPESMLPPPGRPWRAWVVDSVSGTRNDLAQWKPPAARDGSLVHTVAGLLPSGAGIGYPGHGVWQQSQQEFDPAMAVYYPACRTRFGLYDDLSDLTGAQIGRKISYAVVGWFSERGWDPLYNAPMRGMMLGDAKLAFHDRSSLFQEAVTAVPASGSTGAGTPAWIPTGMKISTQASPPTAKLSDIKRAALRGGATQSRVTAASNMATRFPVSASASGALVDAVKAQMAAEELLFHGAVTEVDPTGNYPVAAAIGDKDVRLFPSIKRAMAEIAAKSEDPAAVDFVEMMLQDVDAQKGSLAGVIDMPGAIHGLSFQGIPGRSRCYARIDILKPLPLPPNLPGFDLGEVPFGDSTPSSGHWPTLEGRSKSSEREPRVKDVPNDELLHPGPQPPTAAELHAWVVKVRERFQQTLDAASAAGKEIDSRLLYVTDERTKAQSLELGRTTDKSGTAGAGWWLDIEDDNALKELRKTLLDDAVVRLPYKSNLLEVPGGRWHRPWSPQMVLYGTGRSYRFGAQGRFHIDGCIRTRLGGEIVTALSVGASNRVLAKQLIANANALFSVPGIPGDARLLVAESMLFDTENAAAMAGLALAGTAATSVPEGRGTQLHNQFRSAIRAHVLRRDPTTAATYADSLDAIGIWGEILDNDASSPWIDPRDPVFVDMDYSYIETPMAGGWQLNPDQVEFTRVAGTPVNPAVLNLQERAMLGAAIPQILESTFVTRKALNFLGEFTRGQKPPQGVVEDSFLKLDAVSAALTKLDAALMTQGRRQRSGALRMNKVRVVDMFGVPRAWNSGKNPASAEGDAGWSYFTDLTPRLPYWSRLQFRLQSAGGTGEATPIEGPICGVLVPDFLEHALEIFDGEGKAIGQLTTDQHRAGEDLAPLHVHWKVHPWVGAGDDLNAIANPKLRALVAAVVAQPWTSQAASGVRHESGLSALMRIIDTVRATLDPSVKTPDRKVRLLGEPIVLMPARLTLQTTGVTDPSLISNTDPAAMASPPALPQVKVRVGDITRPDDGVLGCFLEQEGRFAPVSMIAKQKAIMNGLPSGVDFDPNGTPVVHPFIADHPSEFELTPDTAKDVLILADIRAALYATAGVLPRKKIVMPRDFTQAALRNLEPTFAIGPIVTSERFGAVKPLVPPPQIEGYKAEFVYRRQDEGTNAETYPEVPVPPIPPMGELPGGRAILSEGWVRISRAHP